jgi:hypothetical protein
VPIYSKLPTQYRNVAVAVAKRLHQNPQVSYVLAQLRKSLHHSGNAGALSPEQEQELFDGVAQTLMASPSVLQALQAIPSG